MYGFFVSDRLTNANAGGERRSQRLACLLGLFIALIRKNHAGIYGTLCIQRLSTSVGGERAVLPSGFELNKASHNVLGVVTFSNITLSHDGLFWEVQ